MADEGLWQRDKDEFGSGEYTSAGPLAGQFVELTRLLLAASTPAQVLEQVVAAAYRVVPGADLVSVTLRAPDGTFHTPVSTGEVALELDEVQYRAGTGPCVDAADSGSPGYIRSEDLKAEKRWPDFSAAAVRHGYTAILSTVMMPDATPPRVPGALNIYSRRPGALDSRAQDSALLLATHGSLALAGTTAVSRAELESSHLRRAVESRDVIGQAKGILMQRRGLTADEAFDLLRRTSQDLNVKLAEVAQTLASRHSELDTP
ncbi:GAF and ANTAR domain-containing protein [Amycolatopsis sp. CB00013]|uniref:GAF and ANTAR domain-containing protein n=1 Tax=Amycolatopsis sp. CB00013 TaxID=1703945 RepID=UPI00093BC845|nr:GAF and ANTAR domain-containing protein [Amycolatopsis sp. CB00013]OKJ91927.1 histidine kinase [Amycolatopsis sp. CB00013]